MKFYEIWQNSDNLWLVYEVTDYGNHYQLVKTFKTKRGVDHWAQKTWYQVIWR